MANKNFDNTTEENAKFENEEWEYELCDNVDYNGIEYSCYDGTAEASIFVDDDLEDSESITIPQTIVNSENNKTYTVTGYTITRGAYTKISFPSTLKYIQGETFSEINEDILYKLQHNLAENKNFIIKDRFIYQYEDFENDKHVYKLTNLQLNRPQGSFAIPDGVGAIARSLFTNCDKLTEVIIPSSVRYVEFEPFEGCDALKRVVVYAPKTQIKCYDDCYEEINGGIEHIVPKGVEIIFNTKSNKITEMEAKIRVYAKSNNRTALGIMHAWVLMNPQAKMSDIQKAFPEQLNPDCGPGKIFTLADDEYAAEWYFKNENDILLMDNDERVSVVIMWTGKSISLLIEKAAEYGIEVGSDDSVKRGEYRLECVNGYVPPVKKDRPTREMWIEKSSEENVALTDQLLDVINSRFTLSYTNSYIGLGRDGKPSNFMWAVPQKKKLQINIKVAQDPKFDEILKNNFPSNWAYKGDYYCVSAEQDDDIEALQPILRQAEKDFKFRK